MSRGSKSVHKYEYHAVSDDLLKRVKLLTAGGAAGCCAKSICAPLERCKLLSQTGMGRGLWQLLKICHTQEGVFGFWRGNGANCLRVFPNKAILLGCNDIYKTLVCKYFNIEDIPGKRLPGAWGFCTGAFAGMTAVLCTYPIDIVRTQKAGMINAEQHSIRQTAKNVRAQFGMRGLYRGCGTTLLGSIPYEGTKLGVYPVIKGMMPLDEDGRLGTRYKAMAGAISGVICSVPTYPGDTTRRNLQVMAPPRVWQDGSRSGLFWCSDLPLRYDTKSYSTLGQRQIC